LHTTPIHSNLRDTVRDRCEDVAIALLGAPSFATRSELRWRSTYDLALSVTGDKRGLWYDFNRGKGGDMIDLVRDALDCSWENAIFWLRRELAMHLPVETPQHVEKDDRSQAERIAGARAAFARARAARGTLAERYFEQRGLDVPDAWWEQLRFDPSCRMLEGTFPAVLAPLHDVLSLEIVGVHKIALNPDGTNAWRADGRKLKKSAGLVKGAAIMQGRAGEVLVICEGLETAIGITMGNLVPSGTPVWALSGASFLGCFQLVPGVRRLVIGADNDDSGVGLTEARCCARRWAEAGITVDIGWPGRVGADFADAYRHKGLR
jgi:phage/plasmid primase-like uncharacterized protein